MNIEDIERMTWLPKQKKLAEESYSKIIDPAISPGAKAVALSDLMIALSNINDHAITEFYASALAQRKIIKTASFKKEISEMSLEPKQEKVHSNNTMKETQKPIEITAEEKEAAIQLLKSPDLIDRFVQDSESLGCVGERENKIVLKLAMTSRQLKNPINVTVKGESSSGKNFLAVNVGRFFPPESMISISTATPKALYYLTQDLSHKIVVIAEAPGGEDAEYSIRTMQSEGEVVILVPEKDKTTGRIETRERKVRGPVAFIQTTTKPHLHAENETRNFDIFVDESEDQTKKIFETSNSHYLGRRNGGGAESLLHVWHTAHRLLENIPVIIPFVDKIQFPVKPIRVRRDRPRFLALIETSALLHQHQRERREIDGQQYVIANLDDYALAVRVGEKILKSVLRGITPKGEELVTKAQAFLNEEFKRSDLQDRLGWEKKTVEKYLKEAIFLGLIEQTTTGKGVAHKYRFLKAAAEVEGALLSREKLEEVIQLSKPVQTVDWVG